MVHASEKGDSQIRFAPSGEAVLGGVDAFTRLLDRLGKVKEDNSLGDREKDIIFERVTVYVASMQENSEVDDPYDYATE
ncbi:MAG: hypothetical protein HY431_02495 [Candidatus Levybacteria bacterium]|nr:hypothetical protein [Candidatus Levybacteria bacterium]